MSGSAGGGGGPQRQAATEGPGIANAGNTNSGDVRIHHVSVVPTAVPPLPESAFGACKTSGNVFTDTPFKVSGMAPMTRQQSRGPPSAAFRQHGTQLDRPQAS